MTAWSYFYYFMSILNVRGSRLLQANKINILGPISICIMTRIGNPIAEIRRSKDCLISTMGFSILVRQHFYCEFGPWMLVLLFLTSPGSAFIKRDQLDPWIKDQLRNNLLSTILSLQLPNFVSCGRACPSHMTQNLVTVGVKLLIGEWFLFDPWSMDQADLVW